jgi:two-component system, cell cycle response regulator
MKDNLPDINRRNIAKATHLKMMEQSVRDPLTGLHNRRYFDAEMKNVGDNEPGTLVVVDIDRFKKTNDTHGHPVGDLVLVSVTRILQEKVQIVGNESGPDVVARLGGEEFGIYFKNFTNVELVKNRVEEIRRAVEESFVEYEGFKIKTTVSMGVAIREKGEPLENLIIRADKALYEAKNSGRNKYVVSNNNV